MLDLKRYGEADKYLETALMAMPETKVRDSATYVIRRASAQLGLGHVDHAVDMLGSALPLIREAPSQRNVQRARRIRGRVRLPASDTRVQELDEQLTSLTA